MTAIKKKKVKEKTLSNLKKTNDLNMNLKHIFSAINKKEDFAYT